MNEQLQKRLLSLLWRAGGMALIFILDGFLKMLTNGEFSVPQVYVVLGGLIIGEITKFLNSYYT
jgi:hypothetical protein